jgi:hypothetical protein
MTDALNKEIVIGKIYGYSNNSNGITTIVIGKAEEISKVAVKINVISRKTAVYSNDPKKEKINRPWVSVKGNMLFPVTLEEKEEKKDDQIIKF